MKRWAVVRMDEYEPGSIDAPFVLYPGCNYRLWSAPGRPWAIAQVATNNLSRFDGDTRIFILPDSTFDAAWSTIPTNVRNLVKNRAEQAGFTFAVNNNWTVREVLHYLVHQVQPGINIEAGDVQDVE